MHIKTASNKGFTLLEVMIAMVIFAVGMLGLAGIQALSLENSHSSYSRSQAVLLAYEMIDRMNANPTAGTAYEITTTNTPGTPGTLCNAAACSNTQMATFDHWQWKSSLPNLLIGGLGQIVNTAGDSYTVTVHWDEERTGATGTTCPPAVTTDLRCFQLTTRL